MNNNKIKNLKTFTICLLILTAALYFSFGFVNNQINFTKWDINVRIGFVFSWWIIGVIGASFLTDVVFNEDNKK